MNENNIEDGKRRFEDNYFNVVSLPMEEQHATTNEEREEFFENLKMKALGQEEKNIQNEKPLTTDVINRGYPPRQEELDTIQKINEYEKKLLSNNQTLKPNNQDDTKYYIVENGNVFKSINDGIFYELDISKMQWVPNQTYMSLMYDTYLKFSELQNFRDYYIEQKKEEIENRSFSR